MFPLTSEEEPQLILAEYLKPQKLLDKLPLPLPVCLGLLFGAIGSAIFGFVNFMIVLLVLSIITPILYRWLMECVANMIKAYIEKVDRDIIGVDVHIRQVDLSVCYGRLVIYDLRVENPPGFYNKHLLQAQRIVFDLDVEEIFKSRTKRIAVEELGLHGIQVTIEYNSMVFGTGTSNLDTILDFMSKAQAPENQAEDVRDSDSSKEQEEGSEDQTDGRGQQKKESEEATEREIILHKVDFIDVGAKLATKVAATQLACADIRYKNFEKETGSKGLGTSAIVGILFTSLIKSVMANVTAIFYTDGQSCMHRS